MKDKRKRIVVVKSPGQLNYKWKAEVRENNVKWIEHRLLYHDLEHSLGELETAIKNGLTEFRSHRFSYEIEEVEPGGILLALFSVYDPLGNALGRIAALLVVSCIATGLIFLRNHFELPTWLVILITLILIPVCVIVAWIGYNIVGSRFSKNDALSELTKCPKCGGKMKFGSRTNYSDTTAGVGRIVRTTSEESIGVCQKCGFEESS